MQEQAKRALHKLVAKGTVDPVKVGVDGELEEVELTEVGLLQRRLLMLSGHICVLDAQQKADWIAEDHMNWYREHTPREFVSRLSDREKAALRRALG
jgi:hypothetical protein